MRALRFVPLSILCTLYGVSALTSCSPSTGDDPSGQPFGTSGAPGAGNAPVTGAGGNGPLPYGSGGDVVINEPPPSTASGGAPCGATTTKGEEVVIEIPFEVTEEVPQPIALYFIVDESASMFPLKWPAAQGALNAFLADPQSAGLDVAMHYFSANIFPPAVCTAGGPCLGCVACDGADCKTPLYPMGKLPQAGQPMIADLTARGPTGIGTPIEAALRGGTQFCADFQAQHPEEKCVFVLITDGAPNGCSTDSNVLSGIAGTAFTQSGVRTYAIGMDGADFTLLDAIGQAGNGDCTPNAPSFACNAADQAAFGAALAAIRTSVVVTHTETRTEIKKETVDCEFNRPVPQNGEPFDKKQVNVEYVANGQTTKVLKTQNAAACPPEGGWYYDNDADPQKVLVCPSTCTAIQAAGDISVNILLGCETEEIFR